MQYNHHNNKNQNRRLNSLSLKAKEAPTARIKQGRSLLIEAMGRGFTWGAGPLPDHFC